MANNLVQHPLLAKAEDVADEVKLLIEIVFDFVLTCINRTGFKEDEDNLADAGEVVSHLDFPGRRHPDVLPVERAARVHGHILGMRQVSGHDVRHHEPVRPARRLLHGPAAL